MIDERYVAGFFDGEGCIHIARNLRTVLAGCFVPGLLESISVRWGGNVTTYTSPKKNCRKIRRWEICGNRATEFLKCILPYLIEKREQAVLGITYQELKRSLGLKGGKGHMIEHKKLFAEMEASLRAMKKRVHSYL